MPRRLAYWLPVLSYMAAIFWISSAPRMGIPLAANLDKVLHAAEHGILAALLVLAFSRGLARQRSRTWTLHAAFWVAAVYGASDEVHQSFVPGRHASVFDWFADAFGAAASVLLLSVITRRRGGGEGGSDHSSVPRQAAADRSDRVRSTDGGDHR